MLFQSWAGVGEAANHARAGCNGLSRRLVFDGRRSDDKPVIEDVTPYLTNEGQPVWYDKINIDYGETIVTAIQQGISSSGAVVFFVTPHFLMSLVAKTVSSKLLEPDPRTKPGTPIFLKKAAGKGPSRRPAVLSQ
ncbi:toll/interleukin-1 receptor domain-containing protein [Pseudomonas sp. MM213]|uniref:toll/interleukin-1 receptor domain-containing protein n=1 Tax=Pseudomonas sp. MM213 TaxID=2866807 RepID=UPI001CF4C4D8|nr:toll/interleukin-1 receptor domain-containing protein [Pseudomonas sp. MM213]UCP08569.1 toll/interleukin-1 receptor domain-containing protein [Pseudomonas sp. MM213]